MLIFLYFANLAARHLDNRDGQLGYGTTQSHGTSSNQMGDYLGTVDFGTDRTAMFLSAGHYSSCALLDDSSVKCW